MTDTTVPTMPNSTASTIASTLYSSPLSSTVPTTYPTTTINSTTAAINDLTTMSVMSDTNISIMTNTTPSDIAATTTTNNTTTTDTIPTWFSLPNNEAPSMIPTMATTSLSTTTTATVKATNFTITIAATTSPTMITTTPVIKSPTINNATTNTTIPTNTTTTATATTTASTYMITTADSTVPTTTTINNTTVPITNTTMTDTLAMTATTVPTTIRGATTTFTAGTMTTIITTTTVPTKTITMANTSLSLITTNTMTVPAASVTTMTNITDFTSMTASATIATTTSASSTSTTTAAGPTPTVFALEMSVTLDKEYTSELSNASSPAFKELKSRIDTVLEKKYEKIPGVVAVFVTKFRRGSIIIDYVIATTDVNSDELAEANQEVSQVMQLIAPVIGSVSAVYKSPTLINIPDLTYTGSSMILTCGPPPENIILGHISSSEWKFKELNIKDGGRIKISTTSSVSKLTVNNVILADIGAYKCTLKGDRMDFLQLGNVTEAHIKQAPNVRLQSEVNVECTDRQMDFTPLNCCVQQPYRVGWFQRTTPLTSNSTNDTETYCVTYNHKLKSCNGSQEEKLRFQCRVDDPAGYEMTTTMTIFNETAQCDEPPFGTGRVGDKAVIGCDKGQEGSKVAVCQKTENVEWKLESDACIVTKIKELLIDSQDLMVEEIPVFVVNLDRTVQQDKAEITNSSKTVSAVVDILSNIANVSTDVNETVMQNVLNTVTVIIGDDARDSWKLLNANRSSNASSILLGSLETLSNKLVGEFNFETKLILLNRTTFNNSFRANLNSSIMLHITDTNVSNIFVTTITFSSLNNVMPARNSTNNFNATSNETVSGNAINANVVLVRLNGTAHNVTLSYVKLNNSLTANPQCVFWNFTVFNNLGAWDNGGCQFVSDINNKVTCSCNHLTSFSILMATDIPASLREALDIVTYVGVGISLASLVICLIIEGYVWKAITRNSTAFMRHVSIVNTALSLLIADICFIIGAAIAKNPVQDPGEDYNVPVSPCSTATFFMHFFYLALFFWMLVSGLLLFYRTVMVFSQMSKSAMLAIGFTLGYGCPLIIAVITVAVTAPGHGYIRKDYACWLNWTETKALLAMVIPALTIVFINILIIMVVLFKMLRRGVGDTAQRDEKHTLVVIARCVAILTPLFGLTWALGVGTMVSSTNKGVHIAFAFFNSLQGFFILMFGTLYDPKGIIRNMHLL
ncbi:adhesion G protein-coupled receptor F5-like [Channa argus]|uniref:adhesion G protein-coupled receptor F5-like n=1 Tax=Channa argus TaxID=215402 RepID=UPI0035220C42